MPITSPNDFDNAVGKLLIAAWLWQASIVCGGVTAAFALRGALRLGWQFLTRKRNRKVRVVEPIPRPHPPETASLEELARSRKSR